MLERYYELAGVRFRILVPEQWLWSEEGLLTDFAAEPGRYDLECVLSVVEQLSDPEGELCYQDPATQVYQAPGLHLRYKGAVEKSLNGAYLRIRRTGDRSEVQIKRDAIPQGITSKLVISCMEAVHHITAAGGYILHASWIRYRDRAILFTAPSGVGKSTQAALWEKLRGAELINGDRAAVFSTAHGVEVRGIPFCGSSGVSKNLTMPLAAVVYLSQAPSTTVSRLTGARAFRRVWEGCSINLWNREDMEICTQSVLDTVSAVPVYHLACTPDETAVLALEKEGVF